MGRRPQDKGREAENFAVRFLSVNGWPHMERKRLRGAKDQGDLTGAPGLMFEVKYLGAGVAPRMAAWMRQVQVQTVNAGADFGVLIVKPPNIGERNAGKFWAVMYLDVFQSLIDLAGRNGYTRPITRYPHSNARLMLLSARIAELDRIPGADWMIDIAPRAGVEQGLAVMTLERLVPIIRAAGYGSL